MSLGRRSRRLGLVLGTVLVLGAAVLPAAVQATGATPSLHSVSGQVNSLFNGTPFPVPGACVYPFYVATGQSTLGAEGYLATQLLQLSVDPPCTNSSGNYTVTVPSNLVDGLTVKALVVPSNQTLVAQVVDLPTTTGTVNVTLPKSTALIDSIPLTGGSGASWTAAIGLITDHNTGAVLGAGNVLTSLIKNDKANHMYAGVALNADTAVDVHYLVPGYAVTTDVTPTDQSNVLASATSNTVLGTFNVGSLVAVTGEARATATGAAPFQLVGAQCDKGDCGTLGVAGADGSFAFLTVPNKAHTFSYSGAQVRASFNGSTAHLPIRSLIPGGSSLLYGASPRTWFAARPAIVLTGQGTWSFSGGSLESAPFGWRIQTVTGSATTGLGKYTPVTTTTTASMKAALLPGRTECVRVRTSTFYAPIGGIDTGASATQCQTAPLDDRALAFTGSWTKSTNSGAFMKTLSLSHSAHATVGLAHASGHSIVVLWNRAPNGGSFTVAVNGHVLKTVKTGGSTSPRQQTVVSSGSLKAAKIVITALSKAPVAIDALAVTQ